MKHCYVCNDPCFDEYTIQVQDGEVTDVMPICTECYEVHCANDDELEPPSSGDFDGAPWFDT